MTPMPQSRFVYVTDIRTTPEKLWAALIEPEFTRQYWAGTHQVSDWKVGSEWKIMIPDGRVGDSGKILAFDPPKHLSVSWRNELMAELKAEGHSTCTYDLETSGSTVKLTVTHTMDKPDSKLIASVSQGWPNLLAGLKTLLESGTSYHESSVWPEGH